LQTVDALLDIHSTASVTRPFFVIADLPKPRRLADAMAWPSAQQPMPGASKAGHLIDYGRFLDPAEPAVAVIVECRRREDAVSADIAFTAALLFLKANDVASLPDGPGIKLPHQESIRRYQAVEPYLVRSDQFELLLPTDGFFDVAAGARVAVDGGIEVVAPYDPTILAPRPGRPASLWSVAAV
jgi:hypothetical protein